MKGQGRGRNFLAPFVSGVMVIKTGRVSNYPDTCRPGAGRTYQGPTVPFNAKSTHLFRHFPSLSKKSWLLFYTLSPYLLEVFAVLVVLGSGGFLRGLLHRQLFPSLVSWLLSFSFSFSFFFQYFGCSFV
jgi:hypothetical protein